MVQETQLQYFYTDTLPKLYREENEIYPHQTVESGKCTTGIDNKSLSELEFIAFQWEVKSLRHLRQSLKCLNFLLGEVGQDKAEVTFHLDIVSQK